MSATLTVVGCPCGCEPSFGDECITDHHPMRQQRACWSCGAFGLAQLANGVAARAHEAGHPEQHVEAA